ncbi:nitroreductase family protein [Sphingobium sp. Cam5-1]|uniref:nitroreductase family protein n=1 Tax=Sphingobium sp. Cam5-1 TaxID=2789327 RepID=UPI0018AD132F|nr:nitroreductase family protein [Sphingobium sp. Cam5-1]QPI72070.1 nitroreductase family protein [Sphingobium sp. Cam5-1]
MTLNRETDTALDPLFLNRWSPRAFDGSVMAADDLRTILDAGRWAPSSFNYQPWRFLYATRDDAANWARFLDLLIPFNAIWAKEASVLLFILSETTMGSPDKPSHSHSFDAGAAWSAIALQSTLMGYHAHGMVGIDMDKTRAELGVPDGFRIEAAVAIGRMGDPASLPEKLQAREEPSNRKPLEEIAYSGNFRG